jgi:septal ring factor EnvC (AmiA/AmiB activator)
LRHKEDWTLNRVKQTLPWLVFLLAIVPMVAGSAAAQIREQIEKPVSEAVTLRQQTQTAETRWREERQTLIAELEALELKARQLEAQKVALAQSTSAARTRIDAKERELAEIERMTAQIDPFIVEQLGRLETLVAGGLPFLPAERQQRAKSLTALLTDPDTAMSEKLRKTMEALFVEAEYGDTIEVYQETIAIDGQPVLVDLFRLGRLALFYQTLDRKQCGHYDVAAEAWRPLPANHNRAIQAAIEIGARRKPVELLSLPLGRMVAP